ncbi:unnamed protein product [Arctia plantaginis]|uniref:C2H2-type domain-containing protein n=1 Tax=Arctia plantaginis TaxID=874455 RepID=A0A8S1BK92_ARCPL|nr:unnamed protein product [Arctia plantaginis]
MYCISELRKDSHLPSALLSLLSQQAQSQSLASLVPPCIQVTNVLKPAKELASFPGPLHSLASIPENIKAHLLQQAFMQNNNVAQSLDFKLPTKQDPEGDSDAEYDDTDDIVLPEDPDTFYDSSCSFASNSSSHADDSQDGKGQGAEPKGPFVKREAGDEASRHFECKHCGKRYRWKSTLRRHENVECGGKAPAHQCPYCAYRAKQRGNLGVHIRKHHNDEWYVYATSKVRRNKKTSV